MLFASAGGAVSLQFADLTQSNVTFKSNIFTNNLAGNTGGAVFFGCNSLEELRPDCRLNILSFNGDRFKHNLLQEGRRGGGAAVSIDISSPDSQSVYSFNGTTFSHVRRASELRSSPHSCCCDLQNLLGGAVFIVHAAGSHNQHVFQDSVFVNNTNDW